MIVLTAAAATAAAITAATSASVPRVGGTCARTVVDGRVDALLCRPPSGRASVGAVVLHGCSGFGSIDTRVAKGLPRAGIATLYVDYFALTPQQRPREFCNSSEAVTRALPTWQNIVLAAALKLRRAASVRARRVAVVGYSLGASLALLAAEYGARPLTGPPVARSPFDAAVAFSAGAFEAVVSHAASLPPTLVLSGGDRDIVPVASSTQLYRSIKAAGVPAELYVYPHGDHLWLGRQGAAGFRRARAFLRRYLVRVRSGADGRRAVA